MLKSDNEPAIVKLAKESLATLKVSGVDRAGEEHSPPYDSQANGAVEAAIKQVKARIRTLKLSLERHIEKRTLLSHRIMTWLAPQAAAIVRYRVRGPDGQTPYERVRLRPFNGRSICFAGNAGKQKQKTGPRRKLKTDNDFIKESFWESAHRRASTSSTTPRSTLSNLPERFCASPTSWSRT